MKTIIFIHIPKCAGNGFKQIFKAGGLQVIEYCNYLCPGSNHGPAKPNRTIVNRQRLCRRNPANLKPVRTTIYMLTHHVLPRNKKPTDYIVAAVRNPYDWYVSRWSYHIQCGIYEWGRDSRSISDFQRWLRVHAGLYTMRFIECCYQNSDKNDKMVVDQFIKIEEIRTGIQELQKELPFIYKPQLANKSRHLPTASYYTPELYALVYEKDNKIFDRFGYSLDMTI